VDEVAEFGTIVLIGALAILLARLRLLWPVSLTRGERLFVMGGGLRGAVPILLAAVAVAAGAEGADRVFGIVFVVVAFSIVVQGFGFTWVARRLGITIRPAPE
jgi:potassium/hydrogen antiporter